MLFGNQKIMMASEMSEESRITQLLGTWRLDPTDDVARQRYGNITLKFGADGTLLYIVHQPDKDQVVRLIFRIEDSFIITDQPSERRIEKTAYEFLADGTLVLAFGGVKSRFVRGI